MKKKFLSLFDEKMWKFLLVGVVNTLVGYGINLFFLNVVGLGLWISSAINYTVTSVLSYFLNRYFTFRYKEKGWKPVLRFAINIAVCYLLAYGLAQPLVYNILSGSSQSVRDNIATLVGMCFFVGFNYLGQRFFAFRQPKEAEGEKPEESAEADKSEKPADKKSSEKAVREKESEESDHT